MSSTLLVTVLPKEGGEAAAQEYSSKALPMLGGAGAELIKKMKVSHSLIGDMKFAMAMLMDIPSPETIRDVFSSEAYKELIPLRNEGFEFFDVVIAEDF